VRYDKNVTSVAYPPSSSLPAKAQRPTKYVVPLMRTPLRVKRPGRMPRAVWAKLTRSAFPGNPSRTASVLRAASFSFG
jgi:hypothetical protein